MKYVKTFENFDSNQEVNEAYLGLDKVYNKLKDGVSKLAGGIKKKAAEKLVEAIKKSPEVEAQLVQLKEAYNKLSEEDKKKLGGASLSDVPTDKVEEGMLLESKTSDVVRQILRWFSLSVGASAFVGLIVVIVKGVLANSMMPDSGIMGLSLGTLGAILMVTMLGSGLLSTAFEKVD